MLLQVSKGALDLTGPFNPHDKIPHGRETHPDPAAAEQDPGQLGKLPKSP